MPVASWVQEERRGQRKDAYAIRTPLGWTVMGPISNVNHGLSFGVHSISMEENLSNQVKRFWEMESCPGDEKLGESLEEQKARAIMKIKLLHLKMGIFSWDYHGMSHHLPYPTTEHRQTQDCSV